MKPAVYVAQLCEALARNTRLTELDLENCELNDDCATALAAAVGARCAA
jgi:hypothetical protein